MWCSGAFPLAMSSTLSAPHLDCFLTFHSDVLCWHAHPITIKIMLRVLSCHDFMSKTCLIPATRCTQPELLKYIYLLSLKVTLQSGYLALQCFIRSISFGFNLLAPAATYVTQTLNTVKYGAQSKLRNRQKNYTSL